MKVAVRRLVLAATPVLVLGAAGCSIHEQTQRWYPADNGANAEAGDIGLRNVQVVSDGEGTATVIATLTNRGASDDELVEVVIGEVNAELADGPVDVPVRGVADLGPDADRVDGFDVEADPGHTITVEFRFGNAPRTTVEALVRPAEGAYAEALPDAPAEEPTNEPTGEVTATPAGEPTDQPTEEPTGTETPSE
ncbi:PT domain-containing protein [Jiangella endophytica]|uniref:PT domain-containing protein n=1 Tax=Jiangella endophytica TaxID=1623398 RepID=UPI001300A340|nr:PT domain-containing protein [Jiangella endophytica]